jgi:hypothetical protein
VGKKCGADANAENADGLLEMRAWFRERGTGKWHGVIFIGPMAWTNLLIDIGGYHQVTGLLR